MPVDLMLAVLLLIVVVNALLLAVLTVSDRLAVRLPRPVRAPARDAGPALERRQPVPASIPIGSAPGHSLDPGAPLSSDLAELLARPPADPLEEAGYERLTMLERPGRDGETERLVVARQEHGGDGSASAPATAGGHTAHAVPSHSLTIDPLTGLEGPVGWSRIMEIENARLLRYRRPVTIVVADLEGLRRLIDRLGEDPALRLLPVVAESFRREARGSDWIARIGEGRFIALLPETDEIQAINYVERVRMNCEPWLASAAVPMRLAMGWASPPASADLEFAVARAEERMHADRRGSGRPLQTNQLTSSRVVSLPAVAGGDGSAATPAPATTVSAEAAASSEPPSARPRRRARAGREPAAPEGGSAG